MAAAVRLDDFEKSAEQYRVRLQMRQRFINRLNSFNGWCMDDVISGAELAVAGFYSLRNWDKVECPFCLYTLNVVIDPHKPLDPMEMHRSMSKQCPYVTKSVVDLDSIDDEYVEQDDIFNPCCPEYADVEKRFKTFMNPKKWPPRSVLDCRKLAEAGFFATGYRDLAVCFYCGDGLIEWQHDDDPIEEHIQSHPYCSFVHRARAQAAAAAAPPPREAEQPGGNRTCAAERGGGGCSCGKTTNVVYSPSGRKPVHTFSVDRYNKGECTNCTTTVRHSVSAFLLTPPLESDEEEDDSTPLATESHWPHQKAKQSPTTVRTTLSGETTGMGRTSFSMPLRLDRSFLKKLLLQTNDDTDSQSHVVVDVTIESSQEVAATTSKQKTTSAESSVSLGEDRHLCKICLTEEIGVVYMPCKHAAACKKCIKTILDTENRMQRCVICKTGVNGFYQIVLA